METYAQVLNFAIPGFVLLIGLEFLVGRAKGINTIRSMDVISSLSSGLTNILKDVLKLTLVIVGYKWLVGHIAVIETPKGWWLYLMAFVGLDFAGYWYHRLSHRVNYFWNQHLVHHSSEEFNLACALRQQISKIFGFYALLLVPIALLGVPAAVVAVVAPIHLFAQFWYHTRLIKRMGFLEKLIVTPSHHRVHHAINPEYIDKNFGQIFIVWDRLFGTFQEERADIPPIYGIKKQVNTWNPFLINFQHLWSLIQDAWRAEKYWDKVRIWFMPTGWRPADVRKNYPIKILSGKSAYPKYAPAASFWLKAWAWSQLVINMGFMLYLFNILGDLETNEHLIYAFFIGLSIFSYCMLMDRSKHAWWVELIRLGLGIGLFLHQDGWFGLSDYFAPGDLIVMGYLGISFLISIAFTWFEFKKDIQEPIAPASL